LHPAGFGAQYPGEAGSNGRSRRFVVAHRYGTRTRCRRTH